MPPRKLSSLVSRGHLGVVPQVDVKPNLLKGGDLQMTDVRVLRAARLAGGLKLREVGVAAKLDPSAVANCEAGRTRPSVAAAKRWRNGLAELLAQRLEAVQEVLQTL